jgi:hypothetical protein
MTETDCYMASRREVVYSFCYYNIIYSDLVVTCGGRLAWGYEAQWEAARTLDPRWPNPHAPVTRSAQPVGSVSVTWHAAPRLSFLSIGKQSLTNRGWPYVKLGVRGTTTAVNPSKPSGNYNYHLLLQSLTPNRKLTWAKAVSYLTNDRFC